MPDARSRANADFDPAEARRVGGSWVSQGQEHDPPGAGVRRTQAQFCWADFCARGYFVSTVGRDEAIVRECIRNQELECNSLPAPRKYGADTIGEMLMSAYEEYVVKYGSRLFKMAVNDREDVVQSCHVRGKFYEIEELQYLRTLVPRGSIVADVGANVGNHALFFASICRASSVIPFELNEEALLLFKKNVELNNASAIDMSYLGCAVGKNDGFVVKREPKGQHNLGATAFSPSVDATQYMVKALDNMLLGKAVDFIKIDVEGMEFDVLDGAAETIATHRPILFVEVRKRDLKQYYTLMASLDYRIERTFQRYRGVFNFLSIHGR